jgi:hypothetical protein
MRWLRRFRECKVVGRNIREKYSVEWKVGHRRVRSTPLYYLTFSNLFFIFFIFYFLFFYIF